MSNYQLTNHLKKVRKLTKAECHLEQWPNLPAARILLKLFCRVRERGHVLVHKGAEAQPEVAGELAHLMGQLGAQVTDGFQIILHRQREVHQVVHVHRVVLHLPHLQLEPRLAS